MLGKGAAYAQADEQILEFVETTGVPYLPMSMAKGLLPDDHPQSAATARSLALKRADVVMLVGARLNWLLGHGDAPQWNPDAKFIQVDIAAAEMDSNQPIAAPLVGDIGSVMEALLERAKPGQITVQTEWREELTAKSAQNVAKMSGRLEAALTAHPMKFLGALQAIRDVLQDNPQVYVVNEGANALDLARNTIGMQVPRHRLDSGTWGVMGIGMGYAIAAAVETGDPVVAIEGDSAFGFSGMELEAVCRYNLPIVTVILNNSGVYRGDDVSASARPGADSVAGSSRVHDQGVRRQGISGNNAHRGGRLPTGGPGIGQAGTHRLHHRPLRRHRERQHRPPQPQGHHQQVSTRTTTDSSHTETTTRVRKETSHD